MNKYYKSRQTVYQSLRHFKERLYNVLIWDVQNGNIISGLLINLMIDFGDWCQMCIDILMAYMEYSGYIIPQ
ncbi:MAG: hypothetical protein BHV69_03910 [Bacteroidales bacterium 52_46]|nr:MAG: hypothetical protein BHV69_03910 [Bacteroidales bacterium 52_46]